MNESTEDRIFNSLMGALLGDLIEGFADIALGLVKWTFIFTVLLCTSVFYLVFGAHDHFVCNLLLFVYPYKETIKLINSSTLDLKNKNLFYYWISFATIIMLEYVFHSFIISIQSYNVIKCLVLTLILTPIKGKVIFIFLFGYFFIGAHRWVVWNLIHYIYPAYKTIRIIKFETRYSECKSHHNLYLSWAAFATYNIFEDGLHFIISYIPVYNLIKWVILSILLLLINIHHSSEESKYSETEADFKPQPSEFNKKCFKKNKHNK